MPKEIQNKIDEQFEKLFSNELEFKTSSQLEWYEVGEIKNIILDFIHSKLQEAIKGERERIIESLKEDVEPFRVREHCADCLQKLENRGRYIDIKSEVINKIKEL